MVTTGDVAKPAPGVSQHTKKKGRPPGVRPVQLQDTQRHCEDADGPTIPTIGTSCGGAPPLIPPAAPTGSGAGKYVVPSQKKVLTPVAAKGKPEHHIKVLDSIAKNIPNLTRKNNLKNKQKKLTKKRPILQASKQPIEKTSLNLIGYADVGLLREQQHCAAGALGCKRIKDKNGLVVKGDLVMTRMRYKTGHATRGRTTPRKGAKKECAGDRSVFHWECVSENARARLRADHFKELDPEKGRILNDVSPSLKKHILKQIFNAVYDPARCAPHTNPEGGKDYIQLQAKTDNKVVFRERRRAFKKLQRVVRATGYDTIRAMKQARIEVAKEHEMAIGKRARSQQEKVGDDGDDENEEESVEQPPKKRVKVPLTSRN